MARKEKPKLHEAQSRRDGNDNDNDNDDGN